MVLAALTPGKKRYHLAGGCDGAKSSLEGSEKISCSYLDLAEYQFVYLICLFIFISVCCYRNLLKLYWSCA